MIEKSAGESRVPESAGTKPALSADAKSAAENAERKEKGEPLAGGESSAGYMISESAKGTER